MRVSGGWNEKPNIEIVQTICQLLDAMRPKADGGSYASQITYVTDRPGHDRRYAIDARKLEAELGWKPAETFETGIRVAPQAIKPIATADYPTPATRVRQLIPGFATFALSPSI
jgi:dTDP-D-glucose 4,6-dehydratase